MFGLKARWIFFATSHGKSNCDGIAGLLKREVAKESLRRPMDKQILDVQGIDEFAKSNLPNIKTFIVTREELDQQRLIINSVQPQTIPGTRGYHDFTPLSEAVIGCKSISYEKTFALKSDLLRKVSYDWTSNMFVSFVIEKSWKIGFILTTLDDEMIAEILVLQEVKKNVYKWSDSDVSLMVPYSNILYKIKTEEKDNLISIKLGHTISKFKQHIESQQ